MDYKVVCVLFKPCLKAHLNIDALTQDDTQEVGGGALERGQFCRVLAEKEGLLSSDVLTTLEKIYFK